MNENQRTDLYEQVEHTDDSTSATEIRFNAWTKFIIVLYAVVIAMTASMHLHMPMAIVVCLAVFLGYVALEVALHRYAQKHKLLILSPDRTVIGLYFVCICILYCFELGYDIASGCHTSELFLDLMNLCFPFLWFIMVGIEYYLARRDKDEALVIEICITPADHEEEVEE